MNNEMRDMPGFRLMSLIVLILLIILMLFSCTSTPHIKELDSFRAQSCLYVYCESSENNRVKNAGLIIVEIAARSRGIDLELNRGICERYYTKRDIDYRYLARSAIDVCKDE